MKGLECGEKHHAFGSKRLQPLSTHIALGYTLQPIVQESSKTLKIYSLKVLTQVEIEIIQGSLIPQFQSSALVRTVQPTQHEFPISRTPTLFPDKVTTPQDWRYLQKLLQAHLSNHLRDGSTSVVVSRNVTWDFYDIPHLALTAFLLPDFPLSSVTFRYASLAFASYSGARDNRHTLKYLGKFYKHAEQAITSSHPSHERYYEQKFDSLFKFMEMVDTSTQFHVLFSLNNDGSTLFKCNRMMGPLYLSRESGYADVLLDSNQSIFGN